LFDSILLIDWKSEKGYEIHNRSIVSLYKKMFMLMGRTGTTINNADVTKEVFTD